MTPDLIVPINDPDRSASSSSPHRRLWAQLPNDGIVGYYRGYQHAFSFKLSELQSELGVNVGGPMTSMLPDCSWGKFRQGTSYRISSCEHGGKGKGGAA